eukprot:scaffold5532_cov263-Pinguiococcus_pyrenoidosus.AAC.8
MGAVDRRTEVKRAEPIIPQERLWFRPLLEGALDRALSTRPWWPVKLHARPHRPSDGPAGKDPGPRSTNDCGAALACDSRFRGRWHPSPPIGSLLAPPPRLPAMYRCPTGALQVAAAQEHFALRPEHLATSGGCGAFPRASDASPGQRACKG